MDLFAREKLGWFPTLRQASGYSTFFKRRFLRIQCYQNLYRRRVSLRNRLFDPDFFLRSTCPLKLSNFWGGTGYCSDIRSIINVILVSIVWRIEQYLAQSSSHTFSLIPMFPMFSLNMYQLDKQRFEQAYKGRFVISSNIHCIGIGTLHHRIIKCMQFYQCTDSLSVANHFGVTKSPQTKAKSIEDCQTELLRPSLVHSVHNEEDQIIYFDKLIT